MVTRRMTAGVVLFLMLVAIFVISVPSMAGLIEGYVYNPFKGVQTSMNINANKEGDYVTNPASFGQGTTFEATPVGWYQISTLGGGSMMPGVYNLLFQECDNWPRFLMFGVNVTSGTVYVDRKIDDPNSETGITWDGNLRVDWCQSFIATGKSLTQVGLQQAIEFGPDTWISIHDGTPDGPQIGPSKVIPTVVVNPSTAYWSYGEVPLTPGKEYVVKFHVNEGHRPFLGGGRIQGGVAFPDGRTWSDGNLVSDPVKMTLWQDEDGILDVVNTKKTNSGGLPLAYRSVRTVGQTFKAKGKSMLSVSLLCGNTGSQKLVATVHDGPGLAGEGGAKIGAGKNIKPVDWNERSGAIWKPGEVPLQEGKEYYVKIARSDGQPFTVYYVDENEYQDGVLYLDNTAMANADLSTTITTEEFTGSTAISKIQISNINVSRTTNSATITWNTDAATTTNYVEYALTNPYRFKVSDTAGGTSHSVTITGLTANMLYHYRVGSKVAGRRDAVSRDFVFVTDADAPNLVQNPSFEDATASPWIGYTFGGNDLGVRRNLPPGTVPDWFGATAHAGSCFYGGVCNGLKLYAGIYQQVAVDPGKQLNLRAWLWTWQMNTFGAFMQWTDHARIGIDPTGGTDPASLNIVWSPATVAQDLFSNDQKGSYTEGWVSAISGAPYVTVFIEGGSETATAWTIFAFDDVVMTAKDPVEPASIGGIRSLSDGTAVKISNKEVISTPAAQSNEYTSPLLGAFYVEESDRSSGVRVETSGSYSIGDKITVVGVKQTKASGEVYLANASVLASTPGTPGSELKPMMLTSKNVSNIGAANVGMLMRVSGKVTMDDYLKCYVEDGSIPAPGIQLDYRPFLSFWPSYGQTYSITGVVTQIGSASAPKVVITPRSDADIQPTYP